MLAGYIDQLLTGIEVKQPNAQFISILTMWCWGKLSMHTQVIWSLIDRLLHEWINGPGTL